MKNAGLFLTLGSVVVLSVAISSQSRALNQVGPPQFAPVSTGWGHIASFETGWVDDTLAVYIADVPLTNPGRCRVTNSYALDPMEPGNHSHQAAIMGAYFNGKSVRFIVQGCIYDKPRIIGVAVQG